MIKIVNKFIISLLFFCICIVYFNREETLAEEKSVKSEKSLAEFKAYVDKSLITIGDKIKYTMEIDADKSLNVEFPSYVSNLGGFAVTDFGKDEPVKSGRNRIRISQWYIMDTYTTGSYVIPSQYARVSSHDGKKHTLKSPEIFIEVKSVMGESSKNEGLKDIKFPLSISLGIPVSVYIILIIIIIAVTAVIIIYLKKKSKEVIEFSLPPHEQALLDLDKIEKMGLLENGQIKEYYYLVSNVLRVYLENRFSFRAPEQTTEEFLENIAKSDSILEEKYINLLMEYLYHCDLVKYAKLEPERQVSEKLIETTRMFIEETKLQDEFPDQEGIQDEGLQEISK